MSSKQKRNSQVQPIELDLNPLFAVINTLNCLPVVLAGAAISIGIALVNRIASTLLHAMKYGIAPPEMIEVEPVPTKHQEDEAREFYIGHGYVLTDDGELKPLDLFK